VARRFVKREANQPRKTPVTRLMVLKQILVNLFGAGILSRTPGIDCGAGGLDPDRRDRLQKSAIGIPAIGTQLDEMCRPDRIDQPEGERYVWLKLGCFREPLRLFKNDRFNDAFGQTRYVQGSHDVDEVRLL